MAWSKTSWACRVPPSLHHRYVTYAELLNVSFGDCAYHEAAGMMSSSWRAGSGLHTCSSTGWCTLLQAATEQAARALALYAKEAQELRDQLVQAQTQNSRGSGTFATLLKSARGSFLRRGSSGAAPEEVRSLVCVSLALLGR